MSRRELFAGPGRFYRGNLHTHSTISDGALPPDRVAAAYREAGYDFLVLSEHFISHFGWAIADTVDLRTAGFTTLIGAELHAPETDVGELWHILAVGLPLTFEPCAAGETGPDLARRAAAAGAFVAIAHPAWSQLTMADAQRLDAAHAVEIYNHGCAVECDRGDGWYLLDQLWTSGRRLTAIATDDAHFRMRDCFGGWVHVKADSLAPEALLAALKAGHFYASQGPQLHAIVVDGDIVDIACSPVETIAIVCGTSRTVLHTGSAVTSARLDLSKLDRGWLLNHPSDWWRVVVMDEAGRRAWTNPVPRTA